LLLFVAFYPIDRPKDYISGKRYEAQKIINKRRDSNGLFIANAPTEQNAKVDYKRPDAPTASKQAQDEGVDPATVLRNAQFARGVDILIEKNPAVAQAILKPKGGRPPLSKIEVRVLPRLKKRLEKEHPKKFDEIISSGVTAIKESVTSSHAPKGAGLPTSLSGRLFCHLSIGSSPQSEDNLHISRESWYV